MGSSDLSIDHLLNELKELKLQVSEVKADKALRESEQMMTSILAASPVGIVFTQGCVIKWVNAAWVEMFGYHNEQEYLHQPTSIMHPSEQEYERVRTLLYDGVKAGQVSESDANLRRKDGSLFSAQISISLVDNDDPSMGAISAIADMSERIATKHALEEAEEKSRLLVEEVHDGIVVAQDGVIRFVNTAASKIVGYEEREILSSPLIEFIHPDDREMVLERHFSRLAGQEAPARYSFRVVRKDRSIRWVEINSTMAHWDGKAAALFCMTDVTERTQAENTLHESLARYGRVASLTSDIAYSCGKPTDGAYFIDWMTGAAERITGYSVDEIKAMKCWRNLVIDEDLPVFDRNVIGIAPRTSSHCDLRLCHKDGHTVWVSSFAECLLESGFPTSLHLYGGLVDITERKLAEEALLESERKYRELVVNANIVIIRWKSDSTLRL